MAKSFSNQNKKCALCGHKMLFDSNCMEIGSCPCKLEKTPCVAEDLDAAMAMKFE